MALVLNDVRLYGPHFNSLEAMKQASIDELAKVDSMNYKTAETLYNFFRMSKVEKQDVLQGNKM